MRRVVLGSAILAFMAGGVLVAQHASGETQAPRTAGPRSQELMLAGFDMTVARTDKGVSMTCEQGCAWKTLAFPLATKPTPVNEYGMAGDRTDNPEKAGHFLIRIGTKDDRFALSCDRGCAWRTLGWTFPPAGTAVHVNEYGMSEKK